MISDVFSYYMLVRFLGVSRFRRMDRMAQRSWRGPCTFVCYVFELCILGWLYDGLCLESLSNHVRELCHDVWDCVFTSFYYYYITLEWQHFGVGLTIVSKVYKPKSPRTWRGTNLVTLNIFRCSCVCLNRGTWVGRAHSPHRLKTQVKSGC